MSRIGRGIMINLFNYINGGIVNSMVVESNNSEYLIKNNKLNNIFNSEISRIGWNDDMVWIGSSVIFNSV